MTSRLEGKTGGTYPSFNLQHAQLVFLLLDLANDTHERLFNRADMLRIAAETFLALEAGIVQRDDISRTRLPLGLAIIRLTSSSFFNTDAASCSSTI